MVPRNNALIRAAKEVLTEAVDPAVRRTVQMARVAVEGFVGMARNIPVLILAVILFLTAARCHLTELQINPAMVVLAVAPPAKKYALERQELVVRLAATQVAGQPVITAWVV